MYVPSQSEHLWFTYESGSIFPTSSAVTHSRFLAGVAITNISMQLALLYNEPDYLSCNPTSRRGTDYIFTWPRPTVEPMCVRSLCNPMNREVAHMCGGCRSVDPDGEQPNTSTVTLNAWKNMISIHQRIVRTIECKITLILSDLFHEWFHHVRHHVPDGHSIR